MYSQIIAICNGEPKLYINMSEEEHTLTCNSLRFEGYEEKTKLSRLKQKIFCVWYLYTEKQIDLFEPEERFSESLEDKPTLKDVPKDTPLDKSWLDDYLQLIRKTDEPYEDKVKAFKKKWNKRSYFSHEL